MDEAHQPVCGPILSFVMPALTLENEDVCTQLVGHAQLSHKRVNTTRLSGRALILPWSGIPAS